MRTDTRARGWWTRILRPLCTSWRTLIYATFINVKLILPGATLLFWKIASIIRPIQALLIISPSDLHGGVEREYLVPCPPLGRSLMGVTSTRPRPTPRHALSLRTLSLTPSPPTTLKIN